MSVGLFLWLQACTGAQSQTDLHVFAKGTKCTLHVQIAAPAPRKCSLSAHCPVPGRGELFSAGLVRPLVHFNVILSFLRSVLSVLSWTRANNAFHGFWTQRPRRHYSGSWKTLLTWDRGNVRTSAFPGIKRTFCHNKGPIHHKDITTLNVFGLV